LIASPAGGDGATLGPCLDSLEPRPWPTTGDVVDGSPTGRAFRLRAAAWILSFASGTHRRAAQALNWPGARAPILAMDADDVAP
jgi:hypothetical protein